MKLLDKFYTKPEIAQQCFDILRSTINISNEDILLEPSAGSGVFLKCFKNYRYEAYDIEPEGANIEQLDFLTFESEYKDYIVIGNPPFGHRNKLSIDFFNKASSFSKIIGFIIPNTFLKWSVQKQLNKKWKLIKSVDLPSNSFTENNKDYSINCLFQIWVRDDQPGIDLRLQYNPSTYCEDFICWQYNATKEAKKYVYEDWDFAFWRQGYNDYNVFFTKSDRNKVIDIVENTNKQMFFVKCIEPDAKNIIMAMDLNKLAQGNLSTPGFGKADFVSYYLYLKENYR